MIIIFNMLKFSVKISASKGAPAGNYYDDMAN